MVTHCKYCVRKCQHLVAVHVLYSSTFSEFVDPAPPSPDCVCGVRQCDRAEADRGWNAEGADCPHGHPNGPSADCVTVDHQVRLCYRGSSGQIVLPWIIMSDCVSMDHIVLPEIRLCYHGSNCVTRNHIVLPWIRLCYHISSDLVYDN